jgi:hypothetical protein
VKKKYLLLLFYGSFFWLGTVYPQKSISDEIAKIVYMDSIVIKASEKDFSVKDFIDLVREDASFYQAFRNLRTSDYHFVTRMTFFDRKKKESAAYVGQYHQHIENGCRFQEKLYEEARGNFLKKRKQEVNYYTYELFDRLFLLHDTTCHVQIMPLDIRFEGDGTEGHVAELKKLIFSPGTHSDVPLIGSKTEIFSERMMERYNFYIHADKYLDKTDAYVFEIRLKPEYDVDHNNRTVIKKLITYFAKSDFQVLGRSYRLAQYKPFYQFDVRMDIRLEKIHDRYYPSRIVFDGFWNVPLKRKETSIFAIDFSSF